MASFKIDDQIDDHKKDSYILTKKGICMLVVVVVILLLTVGLITGYSVKGKSAETREDNSFTPTNTLTTAVTLPTRVTTGTEPYLNIRLNKNVIPSDYDLFLKVDLDKKSVEGTVTISIKVKTPTRYIFLHAYDYRNIVGYLRNNKTEDLPTKNKYSYNINQYYIIETENEVPVGDYKLYYEFDYILKKNLKGFYQSTYKNAAGKERPVASTQMAPISARLAFPCFDEPAMKATFRITIAHQKNFIAIANMDIETTEEKDGLTYDTFEVSPMMSTYLVAFAVCDYYKRETISNTQRKTSMSYYAPKDQVEQLQYAMVVGSQALEYFEKYYQIDYPLKKADMIVIPDFAWGAMENWGLITYLSSALLYDDKESAVSNKQRVNSIVSHELAHQWFGNIVTMEWWSDIWLNEGFASYVKYLAVNATEPTWNIVDFQVINDMAYGLERDALLTSHPIFVEVTDPAEIDEIFDAISYSKGCSLLRMLENFIGTEAFKKGLVSYLNKYLYKNAKTKDLFDSLTLATFDLGDSINVNQIMNTWILQMGFPVVNLKKEYGGKFSLKQERFLLESSSNFSNPKYKSPYGYKWIIPFNYEVYDISNISDIKMIRKSRTWLNMTDGLISNLNTSSTIVIKGNAGQFGFFRVNYEIDEWRKLEQILKNKHTIFDLKNRAGLIADAFALANSGRLPFNEAMEVADYIHLEKDYIPWKAAYDVLDSLPSRLTKSSKAREYFKRFILNKVNDLYKVYQLNQQTEHLHRHLQILIASLACGNGHKECLSQASQLFEKWRENPEKNKVAGDVRSIVYYYGVYNGGVAEWEFVFDRYQNNQIASEKGKLLNALSATKEDWLINRYLNYALNESIIKSQDVSDVFSSISNSNGRYHAWNFLKYNWEFIYQRYQYSFVLNEIFQSVTSGFSTQYELEQMQLFVRTKMINKGSLPQIIKQCEESIKTNIDWIKRNEAPITKWLQNVAKTLP